MKNRPLAEDTCRVIALGVLLWGTAVVMGTVEGVFDRLSPTELAALSLFAMLYAPATYRLDRGIREFILGRPLWRLAAVAAALDAALGTAIHFAAPWPLIGLFAGPLALTFNIALVERMLRARREPELPGAWRSPNPCMRTI
jgi:hypothetical protein